MRAKEIAEGLSKYFFSSSAYRLTGSTAAIPAATFRQFEPYSSFFGFSVQGVGYSEFDREEAVHVFVAKGNKRTLSHFPPHINGVRLQALNIGKLAVHAEAAASVTNGGYCFQRHGRVACGSSIAPAGYQLAGTLGMLVRRAETNSLFALSNNHVVANCNHSEVGMPILAPAGIDTQANQPDPVTVCRFAEMIELRSGVPSQVPRCRVDLAVGLVHDTSRVSSWQGNSIDEGGFDTPSNVLAANCGVSVKKFGRTTGLTHGTIYAQMATVQLPYKSASFNAVCYFEGVWAVRSDDPEVPFALPGDSGSLVVTADGAESVGVIFGCSPKGEFGFMMPIQSVLEQFGGLEIVSGHGV